MDELEFNKVRKSLLMSWKVCPRQAWYSVRDPEYTQYNEFNLHDPTLLLGQVFHKEMDKFYSKIDIDEMIDIVEGNGDLEGYLFKRFSKTTHETLLKYFHWYAGIEAQRFKTLYEESHTGITQRFIPLYIEEFVEYFDEENKIYRNGHFDRLDYIGPGKLRIAEYKTGESYDTAKSYKLTRLRLELFWYKKIIESMSEFKDYKVVEWQLINPTMEIVFTSKFSVLTERTLENAVPMLAQDINRPEPPDRVLNFYCGRCKFKQECLIKIDQNIFDI